MAQQQEMSKPQPWWARQPLGWELALMLPGYMP